MQVRRTKLAVLTAAALAVGALMAAPASASAAPRAAVPAVAPVGAVTPIAGAVFLPSTVAPGGLSRLTVSATNTGTKRLGNVAMGVLIPLGYTVVSMPPGKLCGARPGLYYCVTSVPAGGTSSFVLRVVGPPSPGDYTVSAYARNINTGNETGALATLTVA